MAEKANTGVAQAVENTSKVMVTADVMNSKLDMLMDKHDQAMESARRTHEDFYRGLRRQDSELRRHGGKSNPRSTFSQVSWLIT